MSNAIINQIINKTKSSTNFVVNNIIAQSFPAQRAFLLCKDNKVAHCARRAAKTYSAVLDLIITGLTIENAAMLFCGLTFDSAKRVLLKQVLPKIRKNVPNLNLKVVDNEIHFENGSIIYLMGLAKDEQQSAKILGTYFHLVVIDECQDMVNIDLKWVIDNVIDPTLLDEGGRLILTGTSCDNINTFFYELTKNGQNSANEHGFAYHKWLTFDNPHNADKLKAKLEKRLKFDPNYLTSNEYRQQWLAEWIVERNKLVYKFHQHNFINPVTNQPWELPTNTTLTWVLGVDVGHTDPDAYVELAYSESDKYLYIVSVFKQDKLNTYETANIIDHYAKRRYYSQIVVDGADKKGVEYYKERIGLNLIATEKRGKYEYQQRFNIELQNGNIRVLPQAKEAILSEASKLIKNPKMPRDDHPNYPNHIMDATLYGFRCCFHWLFADPTEDQEAELILEKELIRQKKQKTTIFDNLINKSNEHRKEDLYGQLRKFANSY